MFDDSQDTGADATSECERLIGTTRRECLGWVIPLNSEHLRAILRDWVTHHNRERPHASLGPGIPDGAAVAPVLKEPRMPDGHRLVAKPVLGALDHEYRLERIAS